MPTPVIRKSQSALVYQTLSDAGEEQPTRG
jgi:hypothetical protein